jgi:hypothetical protein
MFRLSVKDRLQAPELSAANVDNYVPWLRV